MVTNLVHHGYVLNAQQQLMWNARCDLYHRLGEHDERMPVLPEEQRQQYEM